MSEPVYYMHNSTGGKYNATCASIGWLVSMGGGVVFGSHKKELCYTLERALNKDFSQLERVLRKANVHFTWPCGKRYLEISDSDVAVFLYVEPAVVEEMAPCLSAVLYVPWTQNDFRTFYNRFSPTMVYSPGHEDDALEVDVDFSIGGNL